jgi:hypothetical protein
MYHQTVYGKRIVTLLLYALSLYIYTHTHTNYNACQVDGRPSIHASCMTPLLPIIWPWQIPFSRSQATHLGQMNWRELNGILLHIKTTSIKKQYNLGAFFSDLVTDSDAHIHERTLTPINAHTYILLLWAPPNNCLSIVWYIFNMVLC